MCAGKQTEVLEILEQRSQEDWIPDKKHKTGRVRSGVNVCLSGWLGLGWCGIRAVERCIVCSRRSSRGTDTGSQRIKTKVYVARECGKH